MTYKKCIINGCDQEATRGGKYEVGDSTFDFVLCFDCGKRNDDEFWHALFSSIFGYGAGTLGHLYLYPVSVRK